MRTFILKNFKDVVCCKHLDTNPTAKICSTCFSQVAPGNNHTCNTKTAVSNLILLAFSLGSLQAENVASGILRRKMDMECIPDGSSFSLSTGGKPLNVKVGTPDNKASRKSVQQISVSMIKELQVVLELSGRKTEQLISGLRKGLGSRTSIESNVLGKLNDLEESIASFYNIEKVSQTCLGIFIALNAHYIQ